MVVTFSLVLNHSVTSLDLVAVISKVDLKGEHRELPTKLLACLQDIESNHCVILRSHF